ncbi:MAG TPA: ABC transporter transmembrane domain-containing protein [Candidatus Bathyarchaeia archaeon]|nr:ABC transporter transmembrane domain-containing protein [Candidatus Bathyarchaeia archaeon]
MSGSYGTFSTKQEEKRKRTLPDRELIRRVYKYARSYRRNLIIGASATVAGAITGLAAPYMHAIAIDSIIETKDLSAFIWWIPLFVAIIMGNFAFQSIQTYHMRIVGEKVVARMRDDMMEKLQVVSLRYFSEGEAGRIISRPTNDANTVRIFLRLGLTSILVDISSIMGAFAIMLYLDLRLTLLAISILPVAIILVWFLGKYSRAAYRRTLITTSGLTAKMQEDLAGIKVTQAYAQEEETKKKFLKSQDENVKATIRAILIGSSYTPFVIGLRLIGTMIILFYGAMAVINGSIQIGVLVAFTEYQFSYFMPLVDLVSMYDQYQSTMSAIERMFDVIDTKVEVLDAPLQGASH